jgi:hypothetical protein
MIKLSSFRPISEADTLAPFTPCVLKRDMNVRVEFTPGYHGTERRNQLTISTWMGRGIGWLDYEPHWESFKVIPPLYMSQWRKRPQDEPEEGALLLVYLPKRCRTPFNSVRAGIHFGSYLDQELKAYKHLPRDLHGDRRGWVTLPGRACDRFLPIRLS